MIKEQAYVNLLEESFPGIRNTIAYCQNLGFSWQELGFSGKGGQVFLKKIDNEIVSHVAVLECPIMIDEKWYKMAALHAVCTKKDYQKRGFASELVTESLQWAKQTSDLQILFTDIPSFYERLGFTKLQEHRFLLKQKFSKGIKEAHAISTPKDDSLFLRCFSQRAPLSKHFWIKDHGEIASFTTLFATYPSYYSLYYCKEFDGFISWYFEGTTLHLLDIVAASIPKLQDIMQYLPQDIDQIYFYFPTDVLAINAIADAHNYDNAFLMSNKKLDIKKPFMIAPLSRC